MIYSNYNLIITEVFQKGYIIIFSTTFEAMVCAVAKVKATVKLRNPLFGGFLVLCYTGYN